MMIFAYVWYKNEYIDEKSNNYENPINFVFLQQDCKVSMTILFYIWQSWYDMHNVTNVSFYVTFLKNFIIKNNA